MALLLGVDTGGTYTDAALVRGEDEVIATAKALTTRHDLAVGVGEAVRAVMDAAGVSPRDVALTSLSTTLATNALVEGQGARVCLVFIGFSERDIAPPCAAAQPFKGRDKGSCCRERHLKSGTKQAFRTQDEDHGRGQGNRPQREGGPVQEHRPKHHGGHHKRALRRHGSP